MQLDPSNLPPSQQVNLDGIPHPEELKSLLFETARREAPEMFRDTAAGQLAFIVKEVNGRGDLRVEVSTVEVGTLDPSKTHDIWFEIDSHHIGMKPLTLDQRLTFIEIALEALARRNNGNIPPAISVEFMTRNGNSPIILDTDTFAKVISLPGRVRVVASLNDGAEQHYVDAWLFSGDFGTVTLSALRRTDGDIRPASCADEVNTYALDIRSKNLVHQFRLYMMAVPHVLDHAFSVLVDVIQKGGVIKAINEAKSLLLDVVQSPNALAGGLVSPHGSLPKAPSGISAEIFEEIAITDLDREWCKEGGIDCCGFYASDVPGFYRFLDVLRYWDGLNSIMFLGSRSTGALVEAPPDSPNDVKRYLCLINGERMNGELVPSTMNLNIKSGTHENGRARLQEVFLNAVALLRQRGIDTLKAQFS